MKYLGAGPFSVAVNGGDNYDRTFGRRCFYCKSPLTEGTDEWNENCHNACLDTHEITKTDPEPTPDQDRK